MTKLKVLLCGVFGSFMLTFPAIAQINDPNGEQPFDLLGIEREVSEDLIRFGKEEDAKQRIRKRCMKKKGFNYTAVPFILKRNPNHPNEFKQAIRKGQQNKDYISGLSPEKQSEYYMALYGMNSDQISEEGSSGPIPDFNSPGQGGCVGEAEREIEGIFETRNRYIGKIRKAYKDVNDSDELNNINSDWSTCMRSSGNAYESPEHLVAKRDQMFLDQLSAARHNGSKDFKFDPIGLDIANAESQSCKDQVNYGSRKKAILRTYVNKALKDDLKDIKAARKKADKQKLK